jgi:hypothetical protein
LRSNHGRRAGYPLRLERLDDRALPSVTFVEADGTLCIRGDQWANTVVVTDDGSSNAGNIVVLADGQTYTSQTAITTIRFYGRNGNDSFTYNLNFDLTGERNVRAYLGNGEDSFLAHVEGDINDQAALKIWAWGNNGEDQLSFEGVGANVGLGGSLAVHFWGGNAKDTVNVGYSGALNGDVKFVANGGNGKDVMTGNVVVESTVNSETQETVPSTGTLTLKFHGSNGVDDLTVSLSGESDLSTDSKFVICGGQGKDNFLLSANLTPLDPNKK